MASRHLRSDAAGVQTAAMALFEGIFSTSKVMNANTMCPHLHAVLVFFLSPLMLFLSHFLIYVFACVCVCEGGGSMCSLNNLLWLMCDEGARSRSRRSGDTGHSTPRSSHRPRPNHKHSVPRGLWGRQRARKTQHGGCEHGARRVSVGNVPARSW